MKKNIYILLLLPFFLQAQNNPDTGNQVDIVAQQDINDNLNGNIQQNVIQNSNQRNAQASANTNDVSEKDVSEKENKKTYCKECVEIKKLKKRQRAEHFSSGIAGRKKKDHYLQHFYFRTYKKMNNIFGKRKKRKLYYNYSCFVW